MKTALLLLLASTSISFAHANTGSGKIDQRQQIVISNNNLVERQGNAEEQLAQVQQQQINLLTQIQSLLSEVNSKECADAKATEIEAILKQYDKTKRDEANARAELSVVQQSIVEQEHKPKLLNVEDAIQKQLKQLKEEHYFYKSSSLIRMCDYLQH